MANAFSKLLNRFSIKQYHKMFTGSLSRCENQHFKQLTNIYQLYHNILSSQHSILMLVDMCHLTAQV